MEKRRVVFSTNLGGIPEPDCNVCRDLEFQDTPPGSPFPHHSLDILKKSAEDGSGYCSILWDGLQHYSVEWHEMRDDRVMLYLNGDRAPLYDSVPITVYRGENPSDTKKSLELEIYRTEDQQRPIPAFERCSHEIPEDPISGTCFNTIKQWVKRCDINHPECNRPPGILPSRVVNVGTEEPHQEPFLYESQGETAQYLASSHCWGIDRKMLRTTRDVLADHQRKIPFSHKDLSNSFRHAFTICRKLKIQYVWIDSLCVIQDDKNDWEAEAAKMKDVYAGAYLVLSATAAANGSIGCSFRRPPSHKIPFRNSNGGEISLQIRKSTAFHHNIFMDDQPKHDETTLPLLSQGWTLQERLLAKRVLHFSPLEMIWDCCGGIDCECHGIRTLAAIQDTSNVNLFTVNAWRREVSKAIAKGQPYTLWRRLPNAYAALNFTFDSDRLPALYGLAQATQGPSLGINCAGLWTDPPPPQRPIMVLLKASVARKGHGSYPYQAPT